jgi:hypothetical protein
MAEEIEADVEERVRMTRHGMMATFQQNGEIKQVFHMQLLDHEATVKDFLRLREQLACNFGCGDLMDLIRLHHARPTIMEHYWDEFPDFRETKIVHRDPHEFYDPKLPRNRENLSRDPSLY